MPVDDEENTDFSARKLEGELVVNADDSIVEEEDADVAISDDIKLGFFARVTLFLKQVLVELRKTIWPTASETVRYTFVVLVFVCIVVAALAGFDYVVGSLLVGR